MVQKRVDAAGAPGAVDDAVLQEELGTACKAITRTPRPRRCARRENAALEDVGLDPWKRKKYEQSSQKRLDKMNLEFLGVPKTVTGISEHDHTGV